MQNATGSNNHQEHGENDVKAPVGCTGSVISSGGSFVGQGFVKSLTSEGKNEDHILSGPDGLSQEDCKPEVEMLAQEVWDKFLQEKQFKR